MEVSHHGGKETHETSELEQVYRTLSHPGDGSDLEHAEPEKTASKEPATRRKLQAGVLKQFDKISLPMAGGVLGGNPADLLKTVKQRSQLSQSPNPAAASAEGDDTATAGPFVPVVPLRQQTSTADDEQSEAEDWSDSGDDTAKATTKTPPRQAAFATPTMGTDRGSDEKEPESASSDLEQVATRLVRAPSLTAQFQRPKIQKKRLPSRRSTGPEGSKGKPTSEEDGEGSDGSGGAPDDKVPEPSRQTPATHESPPTPTPEPPVPSRPVPEPSKPVEASKPAPAEPAKAVKPPPAAKPKETPAEVSGGVPAKPRPTPPPTKPKSVPMVDTAPVPAKQPETSPKPVPPVAEKPSPKPVKPKPVVSAKTAPAAEAVEPSKPTPQPVVVKAAEVSKPVPSKPVVQSVPVAPKPAAAAPPKSAPKVGAVVAAPAVVKAAPAPAPRVSLDDEDEDDDIMMLLAQKKKAAAPAPKVGATGKRPVSLFEALDDDESSDPW